MTTRGYAVLALLGDMVHFSNANSVHIAGAANLMRVESPKRSSVQAHSALQTESHDEAWPQWEQYFSSLENLTFVQISANRGLHKADPIYGYAMIHHWQGYTIEPHDASFKDVRATYARISGVTPLQLAVSDTDGLTELLMAEGHKASSNNSDQAVDSATKRGELVFDKVPSMTITSLWQKHVATQFPKVDIMTVDAGGAEPKLLKHLAEPLPQFILFKYHLLDRRDYRHLGTSLEEQGYKYIGRNGEDELHQLIDHSKDSTL